MKTKVTPKLLDIVMQTGQARPQTDALLQDIVYLLEAILISWKSKKQDVMAGSSVEVKYRVMALATCELIWLKQLLQVLRFGKDG